MPRSHASEDKQRKEEITARNETDQLIYQTEKNLKEMGDKMDADDKAKLQAALDRAKEAMKGSSHSEIASARDGLNAAWHEAAQKMYSQSSRRVRSRPATAGARSRRRSERTGIRSQTGGSGAVDADYEVVD